MLPLHFLRDNSGAALVAAWINVWKNAALLFFCGETDVSSGAEDVL